MGQNQAKSKTPQRKRLPKPRTIYDRNYYKAKAMLRDPWFIAKTDQLKKRLAEVGCPLPEKSFKTYKAYLAWNKKYWDRYSRNEFLHPIYNSVFREILEHFNIDPKNKEFRTFLEFYFFFGQKEYRTSPLAIKWIRNPKTDELEMFLRIYGHTKKEDIIRHWNRIAMEQKYLKDFIGKNKAWETFYRDIEIYNLYKKMKDPKIKRQPNFQAIDAKLWAVFEKRWPNLTMSGIRTIINRTRKRLGEI